MKLEKAIKVLKEISRACLNRVINENISEYSRKLYEEDIEAIDTVLTALDERYTKGYQDGFKQAKFDCEMDKLDGRI